MLFLIFVPVFFAIFLALALLEVAFYLIILANLLLLLADLLILTVRQPGFALAACVLSLVCLSFPSNVAIAMLLAGEVLVVAAVRFARTHRISIYIAVGLVGLVVVRLTVLFVCLLFVDVDGWTEGVAVRGF